MLLLMIIFMNIEHGISSYDTSIYYVTPNITSSPCLHNQPCNTLDAYIQNSSYYFRSNTTFVFYPGNHLLVNHTIIQNCENIQFVGIGDVTQHLIYEVMMFRRNPNDGNPCPYAEDNQTAFHQSSSVIKCTYSVPSLSGFAFVNVTNLTILNITIYGCGAPVPFTKIDNINNLTASLLIINGYDIKFEGLSIQSSIGYGLLGVNIQGYFHILDSSFINNNAVSGTDVSKFGSQCFYYQSCTQIGVNITSMLFYALLWSDYNYAPGGNAVLLYNDMTSDAYRTDVFLNIDNSIFALGLDSSLTYIPQTLNPVLTTPCYQYGTGLTISAHQTAYDLNVNIRDSIAYRNQAACGSNFYLNDYSGRSHFNVTNTSSIRGSCLNGCGLFYNLKITEQGGSSAPSLVVVDSTFINNYAFSNGSSLYAFINAPQTAQLNLTPNISVIGSGFIGDSALNNVMNLYQSTNDNGVQITLENLTFTSVFCPDGIDTNISLLVSNSSFEGINRAITVQNNTLHIHDCIFGNILMDQGPRIQSGITAMSSMIYFMGQNVFINNNPKDGIGGALELYSSTFQISAPNSIMFINNTASIYGGAIYSSSEYVSKCFFQINDPNGTLLNPNTSMLFDGNSAGFAGSAIYGGDIDDCWLDCDLIPNYNCSAHTSGMILNSILIFINNNTLTSLISSDPYQLCPCENGQPHCEEDYVPKRINTYPGQKTNISLVPVGQRNGFSPGTINKLRPIFISQVIATSCANFTAQFKGVNDYTVMFTTASLITNNAFLSGIFKMMKTWEIVINACPFGFQFNYSTLICDCDPELKRHYITCDINLVLVYRPYQMWIGNVTNPGTNDILSVYEYCPFDYCRPIGMDLDLMDQDEQCDYNRSGVLCGQCQGGLSMVFGSSVCDECSDNTLWLIVLFAGFGIGLVVILFIFNLTVSSGTINGLILYANMIKLNETTFINMNDNSSTVKFCKIFISWLNLDFGIQSCFYNGLNGYVKTWLRLVFPLYLLCLISMIVLVSRYSRIVSKLCRFNAVSVLATLIYLIYSSLSRTAVTILQYALLDNSPPVWFYDGNVEYLGREHAALFVAGLLILIFLTPYTVLLTFLPLFQAKSHLKLFSWVNKMKPLLDSYQAPYKDSYRYWTGVILLARFVLYLVIAFNKANDYKINLTTVIFLSVVLLLATTVLSVYKYWPLCLLDAFFYFNIATLSFVTFSKNSPSPNSTINIIGIFGAFICFICILMINVCNMHKIYIRSILLKVRFIKHQEKLPLLLGNEEQENNLNETHLYREPLSD